MTIKEREIRSYVRREGRFSPGQRRNFTLLENYAIPDGAICWHKVFGRATAPVIEIGFGNGESLLKQAEARPWNDFVGIEVYRPGVSNLLKNIAALGLTNVRVVCQDAVEFIRNRVPPKSCSKVQIFFPDPWPKKKHHKRRLLQADFAATLASVLQDGGLIHFATDWEHYATDVLELLNTQDNFVNLHPDTAFAPRDCGRWQTKFERRGAKLGYAIYDLIFQHRETIIN